MAKEDPKTAGGGAEAPITRDELLALVQTLVANQALTADKVREIATQATVDAYDRTSGKFWDEKLYPKTSDFNPRGDKDHPRGEILGEVFWLGHLLQKDELKPREIELLNLIEPGVYGPENDWVVKDLQPTKDKAKRKILVVFPCKDEDVRARLPQGDRWSGKTGVEQMCEVMLGQLAIPVGA